jgi:hypothetical protein
LLDAVIAQQDFGIAQESKDAFKMIARIIADRIFIHDEIEALRVEDNNFGAIEDLDRDKDTKKFEERMNALRIAIRQKALKL